MTDQTMVSLSPLELDALTELVNLGVGNAAVGLREMVKEEVLLSVPKVAILTRQQAIENLGEGAVKRLVAVHQNFDGDIRGRALLMFPEAQSMELVRAVVGGDLSLDDLIELEQEALAETGNILLNGCLSTLANSFGRTLRVSLPEVVHGDGSEFFNLTSWPRADDGVLFIYINFALRRGDIQGYLAMLLDLPSLVTLKELLASYIVSIGGATTTSATNAS